MKLKVHEAYQQDQYKDTVRIHRERRGGIKSGKLIRLSIKASKNRETLVAVRGLDDESIDSIRMDLETRRRLKASVGQEYDFEAKTIWPWEAILWACGATDPAARIAAWLGVWSFILGVIGAIVGMAGLYVAWH